LHPSQRRRSIASMTPNSPLALPPALAAAGVSLRPVAADDWPFLERLYRIVRWDEFAATGWPDAAKAGFLASQFEFQRRGYAMSNPLAELYVVGHGVAPIGRLYVDRSGRDLELVEISLLPERRGQGLGAALLAMLQDAARTERHERVRLAVAPENPARRLYRRAGFVETAPSSEFGEAHVEMVWTVS
jgi:ribosomal protein S18 acetylase RimI-like enzyme